MIPARPIVREDVAAIVALNNAEMLAMGRVDPEAMTRFLAVSVVSVAIGPAGDPDAFLVAFDHGTPPQGPNHSWFLARHARFLYVDRVCVHERARRRGLARALYAHALSEAERRELPIVCCEVSMDPPNPVSDAFHASLGFVEVGQAFLPDRGKRVRYYERSALPWSR